MQPGRERQRKAESQQAVIQTGQVGFYPLNSLGLSALFHGQASCVIGTGEDTLAQNLRLQSEYVLSEQTIPIQGKIFTGLTDAFYRGKLPELVVVTSEIFGIPQFIEGFMDFLEKLSTLGFVLPEATEEIEILDRYVPQFIITAYGIVFDLLIQKIENSIKHTGGYSDRQKSRILQKFSRGILDSPKEEDYFGVTSLTLYSNPLRINLSGYKSLYTVRANQILEDNKIPTRFNPNGEVGIWECELSLGYQYCIKHLIPNCLERDPSLKIDSKSVSGYFDTLGQKLGILPGLVIEPGGLSFPKSSVRTLSNFDLALLHQLNTLASKVQFDEFSQQLSLLMGIVESAIQSSPQVHQNA